MPTFGLDALSSAAYGPEAALTVLLPLGAAGLTFILPITVAIVILLGIVYFSYRQTIAAYPNGGGSYTVARENLGANAGLLAAAALMTDYVLNVAVGISAGVGALISAVPALQPYTLTLCLVILILLTLVNLRGIGEAGRLFMLPTCIFILSLCAMVVWGVLATISSGGHPQPVVPPAHLAKATEAVSAWLLLRAFASGCTAMTGVEAVSNGVQAFREPVVPAARRTLTVIIAILMVLLLGIAYLAHAYHIGATEPGTPQYQSVLSQLIGAVAGRGIFYWVSIVSILLVLCLSANTSFADFPRLCRAVAEDGYLPYSFTDRGRRLVYSEGIWLLAILSGVLLIVFDGVTDRLIPLFAVGAFLAFTLSQSGMVAHWWKSQERGALASMAVNGLGATATAVTVVVVAVVKFMAGAWIVVLLVPSLVALMLAVRRHYRRIERETAAPGDLKLDEFAGTARDSADHRVEFDRRERPAVRDDAVARGRSAAYRKRRQRQLAQTDLAVARGTAGARGEAGDPAADGAQVAVSIRGAADPRSRPGGRAEEPGSHHRGAAAGARRTAMVPIFSSQPARPDSRRSFAAQGDASNRDRQRALVSA